MNWSLCSSPLLNMLKSHSKSQYHQPDAGLLIWKYQTKVSLLLLCIYKTLGVCQFRGHPGSLKSMKYLVLWSPWRQTNTLGTPHRYTGPWACFTGWGWLWNTETKGVTWSHSEQRASLEVSETHTHTHTHTLTILTLPTTPLNSNLLVNCGCLLMAAAPNPFCAVQIFSCLIIQNKSFFFITDTDSDKEWFSLSHSTFHKPIPPVFTNRDHQVTRLVLTETVCSLCFQVTLTI